VTRRDEAAYLLERSKEFLETAKYQINKGFYGLSVSALSKPYDYSSNQRC
jgi:HEPN domain-containing protein